MALPTLTSIPIKQLELPFIEVWIEQIEFQMEIDEEANNCSPL